MDAYDRLSDKAGLLETQCALSKLADGAYAIADASNYDLAQPAAEVASAAQKAANVKFEMDSPQGSGASSDISNAQFQTALGELKEAMKSMKDALSSTARKNSKTLIAAGYDAGKNQLSTFGQNQAGRAARSLYRKCSNFDGKFDNGCKWTALLPGSEKVASAFVEMEEWEYAMTREYAMTPVYPGMGFGSSWRRSKNNTVIQCVSN